MAGPFKMKGSPMKRNFGISPLKQDKPGVVKPKKKINIGKTIKKAGHVATAAVTFPTMIASMIPQSVKVMGELITGKRKSGELAELNPTTKKLEKGFQKHLDKASQIQSKKKKKKVVIPK